MLIEISFDMYLLLAIVSSCNIVAFLLSNKIDKNLKILFPFFIVTVMFCIFYFTCHN